MNQFKFTVGATPQSLTGILGWNANGTLGSLGITDQLNSSNTQNCTYVHDDLARVQSVNCVNGSTTVWTQSFTLDPFGNVSKSGNSSFSASYLLSNGTTNNREQSVGSCIPTYDANGNLTKDCSFVPAATYTWDMNGHPSSLNGVNLTYDALGREVEIASGSSHTQVLYSPVGKLGLMNGQIPITTRFPLPGGSTAQITGANGTDYTLHAEWLGTSRLATNLNTRAMASDAAYAPFGEVYAPVGNIQYPQDFTGQRQDTLSGLYDFLFRKQSPVQGRWISPDPAGLGAVDMTNPQSWNRYAYLSNGPLNAVDPLGLHDPNELATYNHDFDCAQTFSCTVFTDSNGMQIDSQIAMQELHNGSGAVCQQCAGHPNWVVGANNSVYDLKAIQRIGTDYDLATGQTGPIRFLGWKIIFEKVGRVSDDVPVGMDFINCAGCGQIWRNADRFAKLATAAEVGAVALAVGSPMIAGAYTAGANLSTSAYITVEGLGIPLTDWLSGAAIRMGAPGLLFVATHLPGAVQRCFTYGPC